MSLPLFLLKGWITSGLDSSKKEEIDISLDLFKVRPDPAKQSVDVWPADANFVLYAVVLALCGVAEIY